jgi:NIPSNAP
MSTTREINRGIFHIRKSAPLAIFCTALLSFAAGSLFTARILRPKPVDASSNRVFELMIYHTLPGKAPSLESVFRESYRLQAKYGLDVIGYWVPNDDPAWNDTFIYLIAHPNRAEADAHWKAFHADPAFPPLHAAAAPLIQQVNGDYRVDEIFMRPSDFSRMK